MTTEITTTKQTAPEKRSIIASLAAKLETDPAKLANMLKKTAFSTCKTDEEFMAMCMVANTYNLNPITKEIYAFVGKSGQVVPVVSVDGWAKIMNSHPQFDGVEFEFGDGYCTAIIWRKDRTRPVKVTEFLDECKRGTEPWKQWPRRMLRNKALIQCARIAFGFAGIYDPDEGERIVEAQAENVRTVPRRRRATAAELISGGAVEVYDAQAPAEATAESAPAEEPTPAPADGEQDELFN